MGSFAFVGAASATPSGPINKTCYLVEGASAAYVPSCYTVQTWVQPDTEVPLGTAVHDDAQVTKVYLCNTADVSCVEAEGQDTSRFVTFELFQGGDCNGDYAADPEDVPISSELGTVSSSDVVLAAGEYSYRATYHKTSNYYSEYATGYCEPFTVDKADPTLTTTIVPSNFVDSNGTAHDTANLIDQVEGFPATGDVSFTFYANGHCAGDGSDAGSAALDENGLADGSVETDPLVDAEYSYRASYEGDSNYNPALGVCEALNVRQGEVSPADVVAPPPVKPAAAVVAAARFTG